VNIPAGCIARCAADMYLIVKLLQEGFYVPAGPSGAYNFGSAAACTASFSRSAESKPGFSG